MTPRALRDELLAICGEIVDGAVHHAGAARVWVLMVEANYPHDVEDFRVFAGAVSEIEDDPRNASVYDAAIRDMARAKLAERQ